MASERINDVRAFQSFLDEKLSNDEVKLTLDEALELWDYENSSDDERRATREAISRGLADVDAGWVSSLEEFDRDFRLKHGLALPS